MKSSFRIAEISFGHSYWDASFSFEFENRKFEVQRYGANFSVENVRALIRNLRAQVDAFAISDLPPVVKLDSRSYVHRQYLEIMNIPSSVPLCDGTGLREISNILGIANLIDTKQIDPTRGVLFPSATSCLEVEEYIRHRYPDKIYIGDGYSMLGLPLIVKPFPGLMSISKMTLNLSTLRDLKKNTPLAESSFQKMRRESLGFQVRNLETVCSDLGSLLIFDQVSDFVKDKSLVTWSTHPGMESEIFKHHPRKVFNLIPEVFRISPFMNYPLIDAVVRLTKGRGSALSVLEWESLLVENPDMRTTVREYSMMKKSSMQMAISKGLHQAKKVLLKNQVEPDFAFVVHALSHDDLTRVPGLGVLKMMPKKWEDPFDQMVSKLPPVVYGHIRHVISESTGKEVNGIVYGLFSTPKVLKTADPEVTYEKIQSICLDAAERGAKIIGLGAYTKIVGDSGVTINSNSPIPVTTGNSLSASATLWALNDVVKKMNLISIDANTGKYAGTAMVIGATGSIGKVSARLLSLVFKRLVIVAPRIERLNELKIEIQNAVKDCEVIVSTDANAQASSVDALVTATSAFDHKIVDVMRLKPGCVVCDCSRPLDFDAEDAKKRPDILIIESGEVILPGPSQVDCNLGLPGNVVYACLAETALLALEGRHEPFTLGRDIEWEKVREIYRLSKKHGVRLAAIQGHMGTLTDREIELTRELALSRLKK